MRIDVPTLVIAGELDVFLTHMERVNHDLLEFINANHQSVVQRLAEVQ
jgi:hypothetical protein